MERMNYINRPKECYTQEEWIEYLEESIRELRKEKENLKKEKGEIRQRLVKLEKAQAELSRVKENKELREENKKLNEKVRFLEECLDRKEKLNEEIQRFKDNAMQDMREITELEMENQKLKRAMKALLKNQFQFWNWSGDSIEGKNVTKLQIDGKEYDLGCKIEL